MTTAAKPTKTPNVKFGVYVNATNKTESGCVKVFDSFCEALDALKASPTPRKLFVKRANATDAFHAKKETGFFDEAISESEEAKIARLGRPENFESLSPREQWDVDRDLGILDWDGS